MSKSSKAITVDRVNTLMHRIRKHLQREQDCEGELIRAIVTTAKSLLELKELSGGSWKELLDTPEITQLGMNYTKAAQYVKIAKNSWICKPENWDYLPASYLTLATLAKLEYRVLDQLARKDKITPFISKTDAAHLLPSKSSTSNKSSKVAVATREDRAAKSFSKHFLSVVANIMNNIERQHKYLNNIEVDAKDLETKLTKMITNLIKENS